jgi:hypothetical protein
MRRPGVASTPPWPEGRPVWNAPDGQAPNADYDVDGDVTACVLLVIGYPVALGVLTRLRSVLAERRVWWFVTLEAATASITAGWLLDRRPLPAAVNGTSLVGFALAWLITGHCAGLRANKAR